MKLILASASPRRKEILSRLIGDFEVIPSDAEEKTEGLSPRDTAETLAVRKAESVFARYPGCAVLGADTVVAFEKCILGKPKDEADAAERQKTRSVYGLVPDRTVRQGERRGTFGSGIQ